MHPRCSSVLAGVASALVILSGCGGGAEPSGSSPDGEVVITCATCQQSATDPFLQYNYDAAQRFNEQFAGTYRVETLDNPNAGSSDDRLQYYQRLAMADDLPDLFQLNSGELKALQTTGRLYDFAPDLAADQEWAGTFHEHVFDALRGPEEQIWAIPQQRDAIGVFYNAGLLEDAGYPAFPQTWDEFEELAAALRDDGVTALALDGDWATMLMWVHLVGTAAGGEEFLTSGIAEPGGWGDVPAVVAATERLRSWHVDGYVNADAFSGEFQNAAAAFLSEQAAVIANGPWFVKTNLTGDAASPGLYERTGYAPAPGWEADEQGVIVVSGAGWVSAARDERELEAVRAFLKFVTSQDEVLAQAVATGASPPVLVDPAAAARAELEPLATGLVEQTAEVAHRYPHVRVHGPAGFSTAWRNLWPAYVDGSMSTPEFLDRLAADARAQTGT